MPTERAPADRAAEEAKGKADAELFNGLRQLLSACTKDNRHGQAIVLITALIESGLNNGWVNQTCLAHQAALVEHARERGGVILTAPLSPPTAADAPQAASGAYPTRFNTL